MVKITKKIIPNTHHVVRYVPRSRQSRDPETDKIIGNGLLWTSLQQRENEKYLSVNWLEYEIISNEDEDKEISYEQCLERVRSDLSQVMTKGVAPQSLLTIANVGEIKKACKSAGNTVRITHEPSIKNKSHAGIRKLPNEEDSLLETLANEIFIDSVMSITLQSP